MSSTQALTLLAVAPRADNGVNAGPRDGPWAVLGDEEDPAVGDEGGDGGIA